VRVAQRRRLARRRESHSQLLRIERREFRFERVHVHREGYRLAIPGVRQLVEAYLVELYLRYLFKIDPFAGRGEREIERLRRGTERARIQRLTDRQPGRSGRIPGGVLDELMEEGQEDRLYGEIVPATVQRRRPDQYPSRAHGLLRKGRSPIAEACQHPRKRV